MRFSTALKLVSDDPEVSKIHEKISRLMLAAYDCDVTNVGKPITITFRGVKKLSEKTKRAISNKAGILCPSPSH